MVHEYQVNGITCEGCLVKVKGLLTKVAGVIDVEADLDGRVKINMSRHIPTTEFQAALQGHSRYQLNEVAKVLPAEDGRSFFTTYKPILLVFGYILISTIAVELSQGGFVWMRWMNHFMAGFFLVFSFFKLLDVPAFAASYSSYDIIARRWLGWGYIYPFVELGLGLLFLLNIQPVLTNWITLIVMSVSTIGVMQSLLKKRRFQCACLGAVFNLPMSHITLVEDLLMVAMAAVALMVH